MSAPRQTYGTSDTPPTRGDYTLERFVRGPVFPFRQRNGNRLRIGTAEEVIRSSILMILSTPRGSVPHEPEFGSLLPEILFEPNDNILASAVQRSVKEALTKHEPRISVYDVIVLRRLHDLKIRVDYRITGLGRDAFSLFAADRSAELARGFLRVEGQ